MNSNSSRQSKNAATSYLFDKFNITNIVFCYCLPFFYIFYPALFMPAIILRTFTFIISWIYRSIISQHYLSHQGTANASKQSSSPSSSSFFFSSFTDATSTKKPNFLEDEQEHSTVEDEMNQMYFWLQRCSICLDQTYNLCLDGCRDQFCRDCFTRYIEETINQSWGLGVTHIKCPVCQERIKKSEWSIYVSKEIIEKYNKYNQPYRPFQRYCRTCQSAVEPCPSPRTANDLTKSDKVEKLLQDVNILSLSVAGEQAQQLQSLFQPFSTLTATKTSPPCTTTNTFTRPLTQRGRIYELYQLIIPALKDMYHDSTTYHLASSISKQLISLEIIPELWKQLQFMHISHFPAETCTSCGDTLCLQCGEQAHPEEKNCVTFLRHLLQQQQQEQRLHHDEDRVNIQWKLNHTKPCPNCSIMIERDEGCNKVDCLLCGFKFCWRCGSGWSKQSCGFYQCGAQQQQSSSSINIGIEGSNNDDGLAPVDTIAKPATYMTHSNIQTDGFATTVAMEDAPANAAKAELGVPDMCKIDARRSSHT